MKQHSQDYCLTHSSSKVPCMGNAEDCKARRSCDCNDPSGFLCRSYYICHPQPERLEVCYCLECGSACKVPLVLPYCGKEKPTGTSLSWMDEDFEEHTLGFLCVICADELLKKNLIGLASAGTYFRNEWLILDATVSKLDWQPKHPEMENKVASDEACRD